MRDSFPLLYEGSDSFIYYLETSEFGAPVAVKVLKEVYPSPKQIARLTNEYELTRELSIGGIRKIYKQDKFDDKYALFMEYVDGTTLKSVFGQEQPEDQRKYVIDVLKIAFVTAQTLGEIHQKNVIHKDINSRNILVNLETSTVKIIDFGISSQIDTKTHQLSNPEVLEGTLAYISPEQTGRMNRGVDYRTDLYSFGVTLYEMLTGRLPFDVEDALELVHCHIAKEPVPVCQVVPEIPTILSNIVMKLLAKNAEDRYQSAYGAAWDLKQCLRQLEYPTLPSQRESLIITPFELAQKDGSEKFQIPQKLYGRTDQVNVLLEAFERVCQGAMELMLVAGYSGVGKSSLVHEMYKPITAKRGYFVVGQYDQFQRDIPYSALIQAFTELVNYLLTEDAEQLAAWKAKILEAVGNNGQVLMDVIPELHHIIGDQPAVPDVLPQEARNRFNYVFQSFIRAISQPEHPLVVFLDDMQWADSASLELLKVIIGDINCQYMLCLGSYRTNEVQASHPLSLVVDELTRKQAAVTTLILDNLAFQDVNDLIAETFRGDTEYARPLTELVYQKTQGNAFFVTQFLHSLYEEGLVTYNFAQNQWQWDLNQIHAKNITANVIELLTERIQKLSPDAQRLLQFAACIGTSFDIEMLAMLHEHSRTETFSVLWNALKEGLVTPLSEHYQLLSVAEKIDDPLVGRFRFTHDRIRQASYQMLAEDQRCGIHLKIGRSLLAVTPHEELESAIFDIVNQLNQSIAKITDAQERSRLAELNLLAGKKAKASAAYEPARQCLQTGLDLLQQGSWEDQYPLTLALHTEAAEAAFLCEQPERMTRYVDTILEHARAVLDTVKAYDVLIQSAIAHNQLVEAVNTGLHILKLLGIAFPKKSTKLHIVLALLRIKLLLRGKQIEDLIDLPEITDSKTLAVLNLLSRASTPAYFSNPKLFALLNLKKTALLIKYGHSPVSASSYTAYGIFLCGVTGEIETGYRFGQLALRLLESFHTTEYKARALFIFDSFIRPWKEHIRHSLPSLLNVHHVALETGNVEYAALTLFMHDALAYLSGQELAGLEQRMKKSGLTIRQLGQEASAYRHGIFWQATVNLLRETDNPSYLGGDAYDEATIVPRHQETNDGNALCLLYTVKSSLCYLFGDYAEAYRFINMAAQYLSHVTATQIVPEFYFYDSLICLTRLSDAPVDEQKPLRKRVAANQRKLKKWASHAPMNYQHKWALVEAEQARLAGDDMQAMAYYDLAAAGAREHEYLQEEALACELAGRFWLSRKKEDFARSYLFKARCCYELWGAKVKVRELETSYKAIFACGAEMSARLTETTITTTHSTTLHTTGISNLDTMTVLKASQALSQEVCLDQLLEKTLRIVMENAGASKCLLIRHENGQLFIQARGEMAQETIDTMLAEPISKHADLPLSMVHYVVRTHTPVISNDALQDPTYGLDTYIRDRQPRSILCLPIIHQGQLTGVLYLENNLTTGAFTSDRVELLNILSSQAAISIENATLYANLEEKVQERTGQLEEAHRKILKLEKDALEVQMAGGFAHEMRNALVGALFMIESVTENDETLCQQNDMLLGSLYEAIQPYIPAEKQEVIWTFFDQLERNEETLHHALQAVSRSATDAMEITTLILEYSKLGHGTAGHEEVDLRTVIERIVEEHAAQFAQDRVMVRTQCPAVISTLLGHSAHFHSMVNNIVLNARDELIEVEDDRDRRIDIVLTEQNQMLMVSITDNADGIAEEDRAKIFHPFFSTKPTTGMGLGLSFVAKLVPMYHGTIDVESKVGQGTTFRLTFPSHQQEGDSNHGI